MELTLVLMGAAFGLVGLGWYFSPHRIVLRASRPEPRARIVDTPDGAVVRLVGTLRLRGEGLEAPLSGRRCAYHLVQLDHEVRQPDGTHRWEPAIREARSCDFDLVDDSGHALVRAAGIVVAAARTEAHPSGLDELRPETRAWIAHRATDPRVTDGRPVRVSESVLEAGAHIGVHGHARWEDDTDGATSARGGKTYRDSARPRRLVVEALPGGEPVRASDDP